MENIAKDACAQTGAELKQPYQVMRSAESHHCINDDLSMTIKSFMRVYPYGVKDEHYNVSFFMKTIRNSKPESVEITTGEIHVMLMEKYFKPEMVKW